MQRHDHRVDPDEAQEVVRLAAERHAASPEEGPTVVGLAEALGLPLDELERLLAEVRKRRGVEPKAAKRSFGDRSAAISAAIVFGLVMVVGAFWFGSRMMYRFGTPSSVSSDTAPAFAGPADVVVQGPAGTIIVPREAMKAQVGEPFESLTAEQRRKQAELKSLIKEYEEKQTQASDADIEATIQDLKTKIADIDRGAALAPAAPTPPPAAASAR